MALEFTQDDLLKKEATKFDILATDFFVYYIVFGVCLVPGFLLLGIACFIKYLTN